MIVKLRGLDKIIKNVNQSPKIIKRAKKSGLGSVGYYLIQELKTQITSQGAYASGKWKPQHPLTRLPKKRTGRSERIRLKRNKPLFGLRRFTRYRVSDNAVQVLFARSKKGKVGQFDKLMNDFVARSEFGETQQLTKKSKKFRAARGFAVRKSTTTIRIPPRRTITPVFNKNKNKLLGVFEKKFNESVDRQIRRQND